MSVSLHGRITSEEIFEYIRCHMIFAIFLELFRMLSLFLVYNLYIRKN